MKDILELALSGFWAFVGTLILVSLPFNFLFRCWNRWCRSRNIRAQGWPPPHCDADGDFPKVEEKDEN